MTAARYEIQRELGRGGMGAVYLGVDRALQRQVAIKRLFLQTDPDLLARFQREAELMSRIDHPGVARIIDVVLEGPSAPFLVLELIEGRDLTSIRRARPLFADEVVEIMEQLCDAVAAAHAAGVIHRDLKPENVMRRADGRIAVLDFGVARSVLDERQSLTQTGELLGTAAYMAPEQAQGEAGPASDQYSLGGILYFCLTGRRPFEGTNTLAILAQAATDPPLRPRAIDPEVDPTLEAIALRALAKAPQDRFPSVEDLGAAIRAALDDHAPSGRGVAPGVVAISVAVTAVVVGAALLAAAAITRPSPTPLVSLTRTPTPTLPASPEPAPATPASPTPATPDLRPRLARVIAAFGRPADAAGQRTCAELAAALRADLDAALAQRPRSVELHLLAAELALRTAQTDRAVRLATEARTHGGGGAAADLLGRALLDQAAVRRLRSSEFTPARYRASLQAAARALADAPDHPLRPAQRALTDRKLDEALAALARAPAGPEARHLRCLILFQRVENDQRAERLDEALRRAPCDPRLRRLRAAYRTFLGDARVEEDLTYVAKFGPEAAWTLTYWAEALLRSRTPDRARAWLSRARSLDPTDLRPLKLEARYHATHGNLDKAQALLEELRPRSPDDHELLGLLGYTKHMQRDFEAADRLLTRAAELRPDWPHYWFQLGQVREQLKGRTEAALEAFSRFLKLTPDRPDIWVRVAALHGRLGRHAEAERSANTALQGLKAGHSVPLAAGGRTAALAEAHFNRGAARYAQGVDLHKAGRKRAARRRFEAALADYAAALKYDPRLARAHRYRGVLLLRLGRDREGALALEQYLRWAKPEPRDAPKVRREIEKILGRPSRY